MFFSTESRNELSYGRFDSVLDPRVMYSACKEMKGEIVRIKSVYNKLYVFIHVRDDVKRRRGL